MPSATPSFEEVQARRRTMMESGLAKRKSADRRFRILGFIAVTFSALMLVLTQLVALPVFLHHWDMATLMKVSCLETATGRCRCPGRACLGLAARCCLC